MIDAFTTLRWSVHTFLFSSTWEKSSSMSIKYLSCRSSTEHRKWHHFIKHTRFRDVCGFKCVLTCLDLLLLMSPPFWLSSDCLTLSSSSLKHKHRCYSTDSVHRSAWPADVSVTSLSRPGWVWWDKRAARFLGWFVSLLCCSSVSSWQCEEHLGYHLQNSTAVPSPGLSWKAFQRASSSHRSYLMSVSRMVYRDVQMMYIIDDIDITNNIKIASNDTKHNNRNCF